MKRVVNLYYGFQFFFNLLLWLPIFYEYQRALGLSDPQIFSIQSIYYLFFCLLEIPTGMLADWWGHLTCLRLGAITLVGSNLLPIFLPNYSGFLIHFLLIALARSFISGAAMAYLYDYLRSQGKAETYKKTEGGARALGLVGKVVCWPVVGILMKWHFTLPYWLTAMAALISVGFAWQLPKMTYEFSRNGEIPLGTRLFRVFQILRRSPFLFLVMLQGIAIFTLSRICQVNLFQPILGSKHFDITFFGTVMSLMTVFEAVGSGRSLWLRRLTSDLNAIFILTLVMAGSLLLIPFLGAMASVVCLCLFSYATGLAYPIQSQLMNDNIPDSTYRATLLSVESIIDRAGCAWVASVIGGFLEAGKLDLFLVVASLVTGAGIFAIFLGIRWYRSSPPAVAI